MKNWKHRIDTSLPATLLLFASAACSAGGEAGDPGGPDLGGAGGGFMGTGGGGPGGTVSPSSSGGAPSGGGCTAGTCSSGGTGAAAGTGGSPNNAAGGSAGNGGSLGAGGAANSGGGGSGGAGGGPVMQPFKGVANSPCAARTALHVSWYYNWMQNENEPCSNGLGGEFVPMIWGHSGAEQSASSIRSAVSAFVSKGYGHVLGFNEPDNTGQSNLSVATAVSLLPAFDDPSILVGTPASQANASGQTWFKDYMGQVNANASLRADFIAIHWYGWNAGSCDKNASELESYVKYAEGFAGNRPIWITEWGCLNLSAPTRAGVVDFYNGAVAMFARHPRVERYAWYPWSTNCELNDSDGSLTSLGAAYAAAAAYK